jgi:copper chaperone CopZ
MSNAHGCGQCCGGHCSSTGCDKTTESNDFYEGDDFMQALTFTIEGMSCNHCVTHVKKALESVPGVTSADIDLSSKMASVFGENLIEATLFEAVSAVGYTAK